MTRSTRDSDAIGSEGGAVSQRRRSSLIRLFAFSRPYAGAIILALALSASYSGSRFLRAYLIKPLLDDVVLPGAVVSETSGGSWLPRLFSALPESAPPAETGSAEGEGSTAFRSEAIREDFLFIAALAAALILCMPVLLFARTYLIESVLGRINVDIKQRVCKHLLALPLRYHEDQRRGELLSRTMQDVDSAHGALQLMFGNLLQSVLNVAVGVGFLFSISPQLAASSLVLGPLIFGVISFFGRRIRHSARRRQEKLAEVTGRLVEILSGIKTIKAFGAEAGEDAAFNRDTRQLFTRSMRVVRNRVAARSLVEMINSTLGIGVVIVGTLFVAWGWWGLSAGDLAAFAAILGTTYKPVKDLARGSVRLMDAQPAADRFFEMLDAPLELRDAPDAVRISGVERGLRLRDVSFSYGGHPVLRNVCLDVRAGEAIAIVGPTGAGKTTLADLLLRFYEPTSGHIEIDGVDLRDIQRESLLEQIAVVSQEPFLFDGTIRENLIYGRPQASEEEIRAAARDAHVDEFVGQLSLGYDTPVGVDGVRLSGGQRQRIAIARALLKNPAILVLDEATSALDAKSEQLVQDASIALFRGRRTVFVIAHRMSTIRAADRVAVLDGGRIVQLGSHEELMRQPGLYAEFVELQSG